MLLPRVNKSQLVVSLTKPLRLLADVQSAIRLYHSCSEVRQSLGVHVNGCVRVNHKTARHSMTFKRALLRAYVAATARLICTRLLPDTPPLVRQGQILIWRWTTTNVAVFPWAAQICPRALTPLATTTRPCKNAPRVVATRTAETNAFRSVLLWR